MCYSVVCSAAVWFSNRLIDEVTWVSLLVHKMTEQSDINSTGYGPSAAKQRLYFNGEEAKYELWEARFLGYMRKVKLYDVIEDVLSGGLAADKIPEGSNANAYSELVQFLDDTSLQLIMRDAKNDGRKALGALRKHYRSNSKPKIIALYTELTSLVMTAGKSCTEFVLRAETSSSALKSAGETISDGLLTAMVLKGLPAEYLSFVTVTTQKSATETFAQFKANLRSYEETVKTCGRGASTGESILLARSGGTGGTFPGKCYTCGEVGHRQSFCPKKNQLQPTGGARTRWCENCKSSTHDTSYCRRKESANTCKQVGEEHYFSFQVGINSDYVASADCKMLVDCGASTHMLPDEEAFVEFESKFDPSKHVIKFADGQREVNLAQGKCKALVSMTDKQGNVHKVMLHDALYVPSFQQKIFSV